MNFPRTLLLPMLTLLATLATLSPLPAAEPLRVFLRVAEKTHSPGAHEHPRFLEEWQPLLKARGARCEGALRMPTAEELAHTDVLVLYCADGGDWSEPERAALKAFQARGGGLVTVLDGVCGHDPQWWKSIVGAAWEYKHSIPIWTKLKMHGFDPAHPVTAGARDFELDDEIYEQLHIIPEARPIAQATYEVPNQPGTTKTLPQMWSLEKDGARALTWIQGLKWTSFEQPAYRALLLRAIAWAGRRPAVDELCSKEELDALLKR